MIALKQSVFAATCMFALAACSTAGNYPQQGAEAGRAALPELPMDWTAVAAGQGDVRSGWISAFNDPVLAGLVEEALANNPDLRSAAAQIDGARALARQVASQLSPTVDGAVSVLRSGFVDGPVPTTSLFDAGVQAGWEADLWGRVRADAANAYFSAEGAAADYAYARQALAGAVAELYFLAIAAGEQEEVAQGVYDALAEIDRIVRAREVEGYATAQDVALVRTDLMQARDTLLSVQNLRADAGRALELLLGRYPANTIETSHGLPAIPPPPPSGLPSSLLERRPDIVAAERRIAASIAGVDEAQAARLPRITLTSGIGGSSRELDALLDPANIAWRLAPNIVVPILDGGRRGAALDAAEAAEQQAVADYVSAALAAFGEIENALDANASLAERRVAQQTARESSQDALRIAQLRYSEGETDLIDVLSIQQRVFAAQSNLLAIHRAQAVQYVQLSLALGGHWSDDAAIAL